MRRFATALIALVALSGVAEARSKSGAPAASSGQQAPAAPKTCCKVCTKGKACGDACIQKTDTCSQPPGCACNG